VVTAEMTHHEEGEREGGRERGEGEREGRREGREDERVRGRRSRTKISGSEAEVPVISEMTIAVLTACVTPASIAPAPTRA